MPDITLTVGAPLASFLQGETADHNNRHGTSLTVAEWVVLVLRERAIQGALPLEIEILQRAADTDLQAAIRAKKTQLMAEF